MTWLPQPGWGSGGRIFGNVVRVCKQTTFPCFILINIILGGLWAGVISSLASSLVTARRWCWVGGGTWWCRCPPRCCSESAGTSAAMIVTGIRASNEGYANVRKDFTITEKAPSRAFTWLKVASASIFTIKTVSRHEIGSPMQLSWGTERL